MRILKIKHIKLLAVFLTFYSLETVAQQQENTISQDPKFEQLLSEKRKLNSNTDLNDRYKIQIFYGENDKARKTLSEFKREFENIDGTIIFESPTYKVWVGSFKTRIEGERNLITIKEKYPYALLIKPTK
ncbi:SPOR domain-containing protein [Flavobacterium beibuense]|uniref:Sporulation related protein n=1 Tax=Flavobacterium beibuense TaxID=657326 RepID=A0A444WBV3_9FLAO|nr:SPOR domain-containing protein [Flavobacterium beibuense]RYJ43321.1 Sporulation related protein [Flavobacterium beibuense]